MTERDLVQNLVAARHKTYQLETDLKAASAEEMKAEKALIDYMEQSKISRTADHDRLGYATLAKPRVYATFKKEDEEQVFSFLREIGRDELIKPSIHSASLSALVKERLEVGEPIPEYVGFYLKPSIRLMA